MPVAHAEQDCGQRQPLPGWAKPCQPQTFSEFCVLQFHLGFHYKRIPFHNAIWAPVRRLVPRQTGLGPEIGL
jgi:hypothetical protein